MLFEPIIAVILGFAGLLWSADRFVHGAATVARLLGMPTILIGLTIVAFGTSAPEIIVAASAALSEAGDMAVGNALGSNLANIGLVLGVTVLIAPIPLNARLLRKEIPVLLIVTLIAGGCLYDNNISTIDGIMLITCLLLIFAIMLKNQLSTSITENVVEDADTNKEDSSDKANTRAAWLWLIIGLVLLLASANILVWGAKEIAVHLGVSQLVIGLTVVAVGTSLPELAASVVSALKGHHDIALGNIIGSNILNILAVMSVPGLLSPTQLDAAVFSRDYFAMLLITLLLAAWVVLMTKILPRISKNSHSSLGRIAGLSFLLCYTLYYVVLFTQSSPSGLSH